MHYSTLKDLLGIKRTWYIDFLFRMLEGHKILLTCKIILTSVFAIF